MSRALTPAFAAAAWRYWLCVFPRVCAERRRHSARARAIPDPQLRAVALGAQRKWGNVEGAAAFAAFVPRAHRAAATRAMIGFQAAYNYLDLLSEQPSAHPAANGRALHEALPAALLPAALDSRERLHPGLERSYPDPDTTHPDTTHPDAMRPDLDSRPYPDCYAHNAQREDGGYLRWLVEGCRAALAQLPSYTAVAVPARAAAQRIVEFQSTKTDGRQDDAQALERWARAVAPVAPEQARWWEVAAAGGSSLLVFALIARAASPGLDSRAAAAAAVGAYWPWIGALHSLLDNLIDIEEDRATAQHNLIARYSSPQEAAARMGELARRALRAAWQLPGDPRPDVLVLGAMASFYLSAPAARAPAARPVVAEVLGALGPSARPAMTVFRLRRALAREVDSSPAVRREGTPAAQRLPL